MSSPPEPCSLKAIEHPYSQAFPPFCQALLLRTNKPLSTPQPLSQNSVTGTFTGRDMRLLEQMFCYGYIVNKPAVPSAESIGTGVAGNGRVRSCRDNAPPLEE
jgi:hypothetical protein